MQASPSKTLRRVAILTLLAGTGAAQAHTGYGTSGLFEGLAHPLSGADHLLAMVAVGLWSATALPQGKSWWGPATFLLALLASAALGVAGLTLPFLEQLIALSVVLFGAMLALSRVQLPLAAGLGLVALAAGLHGLAHGAEAPETGFAAYAAGFLLSTAALHLGGLLAGVGIRRALAQRATWVMAGVGTAFSGAGLYLASQV